MRRLLIYMIGLLCPSIVWALDYTTPGADIVPASDPQKLTGDVTITSNYVNSGISQSNNNPALQGGLNYLFNNGLYFNAWGSSVDLSSFANHASQELIGVMGYQKKLTNDFSYAFEFDRHLYPRANTFNYNEFQIKAGYKIFNAAIDYLSDDIRLGNLGTRCSIGIQSDISPAYTFNIQDISFSGNIEYDTIPSNSGNNYMTYDVSIGKMLQKNLKLTLSWTDTNGRADSPPLDSGHLLASLSVKF